ncbi:NAD(P)/FAD-dependent oxidoreductase [Nocardioides pantholopis]|uniref:NAD(P)/FAD-dependent oxidoreductase n=1 Tax=Nocardioides pantholopis TaxID=2483798 RepID=UPI000FD6D5B0|nr:FAD-dependent monooxygenase [Nocardioides pantholopis]
MSGPTTTWDLLVVGAGPAGAATALGALAQDPRLRVGLLDRAAFPRDKACGDGVAPQVLDLLVGVGVRGLLDDRVPVRRLRLQRGAAGVDRDMARPGWVVPRAVFDARLVDAARARGAQLVRHRARRITADQDGPLVDGLHAARVLVGADGASSVVRRACGVAPGPTALALRGYAPVPAERSGAQVIVFGTTRQPSYAWSFDCGDGRANVGYGELLGPHQPAPTRAELLGGVEELLPGAGRGATGWRGHHLPLAGGRWRPPRGPVLLAGDAAGLVNPMTGEGIFYAVATGLAAGRAAAEALAAGDPGSAGRRYARRTRPLLAAHLRHTALAARLVDAGPVLDAALRAAAGDQRVFDDLVALGLADGRITPRVATALLSALLASPPAAHQLQET